MALNSLSYPELVEDMLRAHVTQGLACDQEAFNTCLQLNEHTYEQMV